MKIVVHAKPGAKKEKVEKVDEETFVVSVHEPPIKGLANEAIIVALADYLKVSKSKVKIISGFTSRRKIIEIEM